MKTAESCIAAAIVMLVLMFLIGPCCYDFTRRHISGNQQIFDVSWNYRFCDMYFPDGTMKTVEIESWNDYNGEQLQIKVKNGTVYLVSSINCVLRTK